MDVIGASRAGMHAAAGQALDDLAVVHVDLDHVVEIDAGVAHRVGLRNRAREAVEQEALAQSGCLMRSLTRPMMTSSGTSAPASMNFFASRPSGVPALTAARSMSPVEICGMPNFCEMNAACVPLPAPGAPSRINRISCPFRWTLVIAPRIDGGYRLANAYRSSESGAVRVYAFSVDYKVRSRRRIGGAPHPDHPAYRLPASGACSVIALTTVKPCHSARSCSSASKRSIAGGGKRV